MIRSIHDIVREAEDQYVSREITLGKYVSWSMYDTIEKIDAYLNSVHTTGSNDSLGREKPFFNIVSAATNVWYRSTDIDRKDIRFIPTKSKNNHYQTLGYYQNFSSSDQPDAQKNFLPAQNTKAPRPQQMFNKRFVKCLKKKNCRRNSK